MDESPEELRKRITQERVDAAYERGRSDVLRELRGEFEAYDNKVGKYLLVGNGWLHRVRHYIFLAGLCISPMRRRS